MRYRSKGRFLFHGFVMMPEHMHLLLTPSTTLEQSVGMVKGGISFALKAVQRTGVAGRYYAHRVRDGQDYLGQFQYIANDPERRQYENYPYVHTHYGSLVDGQPEHLSG